MNKIYLFLADRDFPKAQFIQRLKRLGVDERAIRFPSVKRAEFVAPAEVAYALDTVMIPYHDEHGVKFGCLVSHAHEDFEEKALEKALIYFPNYPCYPSDIIMHDMSFGDFSTYNLLMKRFREVDPELISAAGAYLRCGCNSNYASEILFVHRNTFRSRLDRFVEVTGLDIRDYHNALLLEIYFQLRGKA
ncbi:MAG: helix-turn-helix domain-containing protein [Bacilli bacterium]|nr:helix-turn-helix domain-containing protein [Bacilli bacterium]